MPKTVWNTVRKQLPGRWVSVRERVPVTYDVVKTRYEFLIPHAGGGVLDCHVVPGQKPGRVRVPVYSTRPKGRRSISVNVDVTTCNKKRVKRQQCVEVERARCGKRHVPANYTVNPVVCNGQEVKSCCVNVPSLDCEYCTFTRSKIISSGETTFYYLASEKGKNVFCFRKRSA